MPGVALGFLVLALVVTVGGGLLLAVLVGSEHDRRTVTHRDAAERLARRDRGDAGKGDGADGDERSADGVDGNHWG